MLQEHQPKQGEMEFVYLEDLIPQDHLLRKIKKHIKFDFIREKTKHLYCENNGRPAIDPVVLFKMLFIGYLFGIRSERQLVREIQVNLAYRWFLGFNIADKIPDASTLSQNRKRRFNGTPIFREIFDKIVLLSMEHGLVDGKTLYTDSTHLKANANKHKFIVDKKLINTKPYLDELDKAVAEDRSESGKKELQSKKKL
jgi:transposase